MYDVVNAVFSMPDFSQIRWPALILLVAGWVLGVFAPKLAGLFRKLSEQSANRLTTVLRITAAVMMIGSILLLLL